MLWLSVKLIEAKNNLVRVSKKFLTRQEEGATAVEYGLLVALIAGVIILSVTNLGVKVNGAFSGVAANLP